MYVLKGVLPDIHLNYWQAFVLACRHLCQPCISNVDLTVAHRKLLDFLKAYERVNGKAAITPNMHLHMHIRECVQNYGSIYGFWLFSFERFNGIMGAFNTNGRGIEVQIMRKFTTSGILSIFCSACQNSMRICSWNNAAIFCVLIPQKLLMYLTHMHSILEWQQQAQYLAEVPYGTT